MKENGKSNLTPFYLLFGSIIAVIVLPKVLMTLMMLGTGRALSTGQRGFCWYCGYVVGAVLFYLAHSVSRKPLKAVTGILFGLTLLALRQVSFAVHNFGPLKKPDVGTLSKSALAVDIVLLVLEALVFAYLLFVWVLTIRDGEDRIGIGRRFLLAFKGIKENLLCAVLYGALNFGCGFLTDKFITGLGKSRTVMAFFVKLTLLALIVFAALAPVIYLMRKKADELLTGCNVSKKTSDTPADNAAEQSGATTKASLPIPELIVIGVALLIVIIMSVIPLFSKPDRSEAVLDSLNVGMTESFAYATKRDWLMALKSVDKARALPSAWKAYLDGDSKAAGEAYELDRTLPMVELLYYYTWAENGAPAKEKDDEAENKDTVKQNPPDILSSLAAHEGEEIWYFGFLDVLSEEDSLTKAEQQEKRRIIMQLAAGNIFNCGAVLPSELTDDERDEISKGLDDFEDPAERYSDYIAVWEILELYVERDGVDAEVADRVAELAVQYPGSEPVRSLLFMVLAECVTGHENMSGLFDWTFPRNILNGLFDAVEEDKESFALNELTILAARQYIVSYRDNYTWAEEVQNTAREKTYPIILNFDRLFEYELSRDNSLSAEEKNSARIVHFLDMAEVMMDMEMSRQLQEYLEAVMQVVPDDRIESILGAAALANGDYDTALPIMEKDYASDKNNLELTIELAILYYRSGDVTKSLEKAVSFTEGMLASGVLENKPQLGTDFTALIATYITGDKSVADRSGGKHCPYKDFTDEQKAIVAKSSLLEKMLDCEYRYQYEINDYMRWDKADEYRKLEEDAFAFTKDYPLLSTGYYLAGRVYGHYTQEFWTDKDAQAELIDTGKAIELYEKCLSFEDNQPAVWYSLALTLSELKQYKEALVACNKAIDHMYYESWYGRYGDEYHGWGIREHAENLAGFLKRQLAENQ